MRNLKILGAALMATLALSAVAASSAFATYDQALLGEPATISGSQVTQNVFNTNSGTVKCEEAEFSGHGIGTMTEPTTGITTYAEVTVHPTYGTCRAFGLAATVTTTGCNYVFGTATTTPTDAHAVASIECEGTSKIVVNAGAGGCIVEVGAQTTGGVVKFANESPNVLATAEVEAITYHQEGTKCTGGNGTFANGKYTGTVRLGGKNPNTGTAVAISVT